MKQSALRDELIAAMHATAARPKGRRGRPPADSVAEVETGMRRFAVEVFIAERALGRRRGDLAKSIREIAARYGLNEETLRKAVYRHQDLREVADVRAVVDRLEADLAELHERMRGFPPLVRQWLGPFSARKVLALLRAEGVAGGQCPDWLIEAARRFNVPKREREGAYIP